ADRLEDVAHAADGVDHRLAAGVDLLAQVADVQLDHVRLAAEVVVPDPVEDLGLGQHPARVAHEETQQLELRGGELDQLAPPPRALAPRQARRQDSAPPRCPGRARPRPPPRPPAPPPPPDCPSGPKRAPPRGRPPPRGPPPPPGRKETPPTRGEARPGPAA